MLRGDADTLGKEQIDTNDILGSIGTLLNALDDLHGRLS